MDQKNILRVTQAPGELAPCSFHWAGRLVRVLYVERVHTRGVERRYRVQTPEGIYELSLNTLSGAWSMRHSPSRLSRAWTQMRHMPRYPLSHHRRRGLWQPVTAATSMAAQGK